MAVQVTYLAVPYGWIVFGVRQQNSAQRMPAGRVHDRMRWEGAVEVFRDLGSPVSGGLWGALSVAGFGVWGLGSR